jgi:TonB family protein
MLLPMVAGKALGLPLTLRPDGQDLSISDRSESPDHRGLVPEILPPLADVSSLARTLADHGAGDFSPEVALDLVLHEIAEHIRQATSADAAALALRHGDEMVCRAAAGASAPELGTRVNVRSGLSGLSLQTGEWQYCQDCETDPRVDVETCRRLRARSFIVMPVVDEVGPFGVIQISSAAPNAFSQKDVEILRQNGRSIVWARRQVEQPRIAQTVTPPGSNIADNSAPAGYSPSTTSHPIDDSNGLRSLSESRDQDTSPGDVSYPSFDGRAPREIITVPTDSLPYADVSDSELRTKETAGTWRSRQDDADTYLKRKSVRRSHEILTAILGIMVVAAALLLGTLIGIRFGWQKAVRLPVTNKATAQVPPAATIPTLKNSSESLQSNASPVPESGAVKSAPVSGHLSALAAPTTHPTSSNERVGGLVVYQNDKVVFQQSGEAPSDSDVGASASPAMPTTTIPSEVAAVRLVHRVEPDYPAEAAKRGISGRVRLQALIDTSGDVVNVGLIEGNSVLAASAMKAVRQWHYQPYLVNGVAISVQTDIAITFTPSAH